MNSHPNLFKQATVSVMQDLIDGLLVEEFFGDISEQLYSLEQWDQLTKATPHLASSTLFPSLDLQAEIWKLSIPNENINILIALMPALTQKWQKVSNTPVYAVSSLEKENLDQLTLLDPVTFMQYVAEKYYPNKPKAIHNFLDLLQENIKQLEWSQNHQIDHKKLFSKSPAEFFQCMEQWASLRDRPYHPLAKAKTGLNQQDYSQYMAEFSKKIPLFWIAVHKDYLMIGNGIEDISKQHPLHYFLTQQEQVELLAELEQLNVLDTHIALPVHPWQFDRVIQKFLPDTFIQKKCVALKFQSTPFNATSSLRSLAPASESPFYLKLPMDIYSLCSARYLPAIKMINGQKSQQLLQDAISKDPNLKDKLWLCDEAIWWAYLPENIHDYHPDNEILYAQEPRHLSAMLRHYPNELLENTQFKLIPMATLGTVIPNSSHHFFDDWMRYRQLPPNQTSVRLLFKELCTSFYEVNLRLFKLGMVGEMHGQNAVFVWKDGHAQGILMRDHDALRVCVPLLEQNGLSDPEYSIKKGYPNTLYNQLPEDLFFFFQTLGIQVNLRAIIDTLAQIYSIPPAILWQDMNISIKQIVTKIGLDCSMQILLNQLLFTEKFWPFKMLLTPMFEHDDDDPGSMPFGKGHIPNPFLQYHKFL